MIYPTTLKLKEYLTDQLTVPVYTATVPMKTKRPYVTLHLKDIQVGQGSFLGQFRLGLEVTLWVDSKRDAQARPILEMLHQKLFPMRFQEQGGQSFLQMNPQVTTTCHKGEILSYEMILKGQGSSGP